MHMAKMQQVEAPSSILCVKVVLQHLFTSHSNCIAQPAVNLGNISMTLGFHRDVILLVKHLL